MRNIRNGVKSSGTWRRGGAPALLIKWLRTELGGEPRRVGDALGVRWVRIEKFGERRIGQRCLQASKEGYGGLRLIAGGRGVGAQISSAERMTRLINP